MLPCRPNRTGCYRDPALRSGLGHKFPLEIQTGAASAGAAPFQRNDMFCPERSEGTLLP
jgi:hypothetical protein